MPIIFRTTDVAKWGAGKGANLTAIEADGNFWELLSRLMALETSPPAAISVDTFEVVGSQLYVHMTDASVQGPFQLPVAAWGLPTAWLPVTPYATLDVVTFGGRTYLVTWPHTSAATFVAGANDGAGNDYYRLLLDNPDQIFDLGLFFPDRVRAGGAVLFQHSATREIILRAGLPASVAYLNVAPSTAAVVLQLYRNAFLIGTLDFSIGADADGGKAGVFTLAVETSIMPGERFSIRESFGTEDATALGLSVTINADVA